MSFFTILRHSALSLFLILSMALSAQQLYQVSGVEVDRHGNALTNAWVGGFNNPVISPMDLNQDGMMDLFIYDKAGLKAQAFINTGSPGHISYTYAPEYDVVFPKNLYEWVLIRDYNGDGVPDIFALRANVNIMVYQGSRVQGGGLTFTKITDKINYTYGVAGHSGIYVYSDNMPIITDMDGDGDLDIIAPDVTGTQIYYHKNQSVEMGYGRDSLIYTLAYSCWGEIYAGSGCGVAFAPCKADGPNPSPSMASGQRDNAGALYAFDYQGDRDMDLLLADPSCNSIKFIQNDGDSVDLIINYTDTLFPSYDRSVKMSTYPAAYGADVDNDGYDDLLIAPFLSNIYYVMKSEDIQCLQFYQNDGPTPPLNRFHYMGDSLITSTTVDVGTESHAVFFDYNSDGLMDMVVGNFGRFRANPTLALYENIGNDTMPKFNEVSTNWSNINAFNLSGVYPAFGDLDGDGHPDMVIGEQTGQIHFFKNTGVNTATYPSMTHQNWFGINAGSGAAPFIYDLNGDSLNDLIIGTVNNNIKYYWNFGTRTVPQFSPDSVNSFLGHIKVSSAIPQTIEYRTPVIHIDSGQTYLYTGSREGRVEKYLVDMDSLRQGAFTKLSHDLIGISPGIHANVSIADINHDGHNDYLMGNVRGGLMLFSDAYWGNGITLPASVTGISHPDNKIQVYPIPARDIVQCRLLSDDGKLVTARMYDLLGKLVTTPVTDNGDGLTISVAALPSGIYVVQLTDERGKTYQQKVSVMK